MMGRGVSSRTAAVGLLTLCVGALEPVIFVKLHRVGGTTLQNLLVRHAVNRNRTVLCTHMVASFNPGSLIDPQCQLLQRAVATLNQKVQVPDHVKRAFADRLCPSPRSPRGSAKADPDYVPVFRDADVRRAVADLDAALARLRRRSRAPRLSLSSRTGSRGGSLRF